jgi:hypothetical protein
MCHGSDRRAWERETEEEDEPMEAEEPSFLEDEPAEDVELLTDGGDEDDG